MQVRLAIESDIDQLVRMRWDFTYEKEITASYKDSHTECRTFLMEAIHSQRWFIWVAEMDNRIVSHIYIELINKVLLQINSGILLIKIWICISRKKEN